MTPIQAKRAALYRSFEDRFRNAYAQPAAVAPKAIDPASVAQVELALNCRFPDSYRAFVTTVGPCEVRGLSDAWLATGRATVAYPMPFDFLWHPQDTLKQCGEEWLAPIPAELAGGAAVASDVAWKYLLPFASDGAGNWHCFPRQPFPTPDLPVYYFDHDGGDIDRIAAGLEDLIERYLGIPDP